NCALPISQVRCRVRHHTNINFSYKPPISCGSTTPPEAPQRRAGSPAKNRIHRSLLPAIIITTDIPALIGKVH
ncbi:MAG: hypothetical protein ABIH42_04570, partial [Planctomycetota bacterium]